MDLNSLIKKEEISIDFGIEPTKKDADGVLKQLDKTFVYLLASGSLEDGFPLPRLNDCKDLNVSRGSLFSFYSKMKERFNEYLGRAEDDPKDNPANLIEDYTLRLKYSEDLFLLTEKLFVEESDRAGKNQDENRGLFDEIDDIIKQCVSIRYSKQKIMDRFTRKMNEVLYNVENRNFFSELTCEFQKNYKKGDYLQKVADILIREGKGLAKKAGEKIEALITDYSVPFEGMLDKKKWNVTYFTPENGLSYSDINFEKGATTYKKYDVIYCPDHSFCESFFSADAIYNFLLTAKNKLNPGGKLIINLFDPDMQFVKNSMEKTNQQTRIDVVLDRNGNVLKQDGLAQEGEGSATERSKVLAEKAINRLKEKMTGTRYAGKELNLVSLKKTSSFIHCDTDCAAFKKALGVPTDLTCYDNDPSKEIKIWTFLEELRYDISDGEEAAYAKDMPQMNYATYLAFKNSEMEKRVILRDMLEYVLIDPTTFENVLKNCGFGVRLVGSDLEPYPVGPGTADKNVYFICKA